jgi:hypothetical protein
MFWRYRKVLRDRAAGMVFDWRRGHGSSYRLLIAFVVSVAFWGGIYGFLQVDEAGSVELEKNEIDVAVVDLDAEQNRWLAELIDRKTLFQQRWSVKDPTVIDNVVEEAMAATFPRGYDPTLRQISLPQPEASLANLPGMGPDALPRPDAVASVRYATEKEDWWIEVKVIEGPDGLDSFRFPFEWPQDPKLMSEGEIWAVVLIADWQGSVVAVESWWEKANDVRTQPVLERLRSAKIEPIIKKGSLRTWRLEAEVVNRLSE